MDGDTLPHSNSIVVIRANHGFLLRFVVFVVACKKFASGAILAFSADVAFVRYFVLSS